MRGRNAAGETFGGGRLRRVDFSCIIFCILLRATVTSAVGAWTCGVALRGSSSQVRGVVQQRRDRGQGVSGSIFGGSEPGGSSYVASSGSCLVDTHCGDIYRFRFPCGKGSFPLPACCAVCCGVSDEQESGAAAGSRSDRECPRPAVAGCRRLSGSPSPGVSACYGRPTKPRLRALHDGRFFKMSSAVAGS